MKKIIAKQYTTENNYQSQKITLVPNIIHFIYGFKPQETEFEYYKYIAICSAYLVNKPDRIYFYYKYEPFGFYWNKVKNLLTLKKVEPPTEFLGKKIKHYAHQADILRLQVLYNYGGIYLDIDTICLKELKDFFTENITLGYQGEHGLCNAVIIAKQYNSFIKEWLQAYKSFRSEGQDAYYDEHSVILPMKMAFQRNDINVVNRNTFFYPMAEHINDILFQDTYSQEHKQFIDNNSYCIHLWETITYSNLKDIEKKKKSLYYTYSQNFHL